MGRMLAGLIEQAADLRLAAALERPDHPDLGQAIAAGVVLGHDLGAALAAADVLLDFSLAQAAVGHVEAAAVAGRAVVCGTTGFDSAGRAALARAAERVALVHSSNMSRGVFVLSELVRRAAGALGRDHDVEIVETHHRHKADAPSGTARLLGEAVLQVRGGALVYGREGLRAPGEIGLAAIRGGDVVGEHQVFFLGPGEELILTHRATTREHFCRGALAAVRFVAGRGPGLYDMADVFGAQKD